MNRPTLKGLPSLAARRDALLRLGFLVALSVVMTAELWNAAWVIGHEDSRYVTRAVEYVRIWHDGTLYPRWSPDFYGGFGTPLFDFFPPVLFALTGVIGFLGFSTLNALKVATILLTLVGGAGAYRVGYAETGRRDAALVGATAFMFMPYRFVDLLMRNDLCEYVAISFVPWTIYYFRELARTPHEKLARGMFLAALAMALTMMSHPIIGFWSALTLPLYFGWPAVESWRRGERLRAASPVLAGVGGVLLSAIYAFPAYFDKQYCHFDRMTSNYNDPVNHLVPVQLFFKLWFYDNVTDQTDGRMPFTIGVPLVVAMGLVLPCLAWPASRRVLRRSAMWWGAVALLIFLMTPTAGFVYAFTLTKFIQFPWRLIGLVCAVGTVAIATTVAACFEVPALRRMAPSLTLLAIVGILIGADPLELMNRYIPLQQLQLTPEAISAAVSDATTNHHEHLPVNVSERPDHVRTTLVKPAGGTVTATATVHDGTDYQIDVNAQTAWALDMELFSFPGWRVETLSGPPGTRLLPSPKSLVRLEGQRPGQYKLHVWFGSTPLRTWSTIVSLLALVLLLPGFRWLERRWPPQPEGE